MDPSADCMILCGKTEENLSHLEVYVYAPADDHLYVHHDILLPSFPLCVESVSAPVGASEGRNFCAVGTFESEIEVVDLCTYGYVLDVIDLYHNPDYRSGTWTYSTSCIRIQSSGANRMR